MYFGRNYFHYDGLGRRYALRDSDGLAYFSWDPNGVAPIVERDETGAPIAGYVNGEAPVPGAGSLTAAARVSGATTYQQYPVFNATGDLMRITNETGAVTGSFEYDAFGNVVSETMPTEGTRFGKCAPSWIRLTDDPDNNLYVTPTRVYHSGVGRFLQRDPAAGFAGGYTYANNAPTNYVDVNGRDPEEATGETKHTVKWGDTLWYLCFGKYRQHQITPSDILKANGMEQWDVQIGSVIVIPKKKDAIPLKNIKRQAWWYMPALDYMSPVVRSEAQQMWDNIKTLQLRRWWASEGLDEWTAQDDMMLNTYGNAYVEKGYTVPKPPEQPYSYSSGLAHALAADLVYNILAEIRLPILLKQRALQEKIDDEIFRLKTINRFSGVANVGVGMIELAAATPCLLAPEPTMASKVAGGFLLWRSAEDFTVGGAKIWSGKDQGSLTEQALANVIGGDAAKYTLLTADVAALSYAAALSTYGKQAGKIAASDLARVEKQLAAIERKPLYSYSDKLYDASKGGFTASSGRVYMTAKGPGKWLYEKGTKAGLRRFIHTGRWEAYNPEMLTTFTTGSNAETLQYFSRIGHRPANIWKYFGEQYSTRIGISGFKINPTAIAPNRYLLTPELVRSSLWKTTKSIGGFGIETGVELTPTPILYQYLKLENLKQNNQR